VPPFSCVTRPRRYPCITVENAGGLNRQHLLEFFAM
jgi:hypothetical protein